MPATTRPSDTTPIGASSPQLFHSAHGFTIEGGRGPTFNVYPSIETSTYPHPPIAPSTSNVDRMPDRAAGSTPFVESDVYAQLLLPCRQGYPLWEPKTYNEHLPEVYKKVGVHLGDVGLLTRLGGFDYLFNVCHEADHELNRGRVPVDFIPISNYIADRDINQHEFPIGSHFLSDATQIRRHKIQIENIHHGPMNQFEFDLRDKFGGGRAYSSTTSEGALLILPEGARRLDYLHSKPLLDYALDHAASWFTHASEALGRITENRLYVITGVHKARAWGMAAFRNANPQDVALEFVPKYSGENSTGFPEYDFRTCDSAVAANGADDTYRQQSGSVFLRGWRISMRKRLTTRSPIRQ
ncbi:hypothetical protein EV361DRAFT_224778 [Lentinula raphanica]|nr:hypothetical protein C8R42DRAFT_479852 [Lentinula raphanica]KAJ3971369.1 hypothetical protein EV361DRAFT_224778 [Lentinula raphanica]